MDFLYTADPRDLDSGFREALRILATPRRSGPTLYINDLARTRAEAVAWRERAGR